MKEKYLYKCIIIVFLCFIVDSTLSFFLPYNYIKDSVSVIPYIGLMMFSLIVKTIDVPERYFFAAICGTYYSVVYTNSLAIYILVYCLIAFIRSYIIKLESFSVLESSLFALSTIMLCEVIVYWLLWMTNTTNYPLDQFLLMRLLPTLVVNFILSLFVVGIYNHVKIEEK